MKRQSTRERILVTCRKLFNAKGVIAVTTAAIAEAVGINEGNLYYYFKKKSDVITALFEQFSEEQLAIAARDQDLQAWFQLMWEWRFFYRDSVTIFTMEPALRARLHALSDQVQDHGRAKLREMVSNGRLNATESQLEVLLENSWIISTYWIEYLHSRHGINRVTKKHLAWGYRQMSALFEPYLVRSRDTRALATAQSVGE
ncbi:MAG TPA: TetR/AcrR family transcriptional regulator [Pseudomonas xinjiangensis]|uniref:TetR/AcrR family transcriptional regulator n=2 Tax=root TaxID=1 RepID=A0A7V1BQX1_9GAMM|nr:TetR/AcrR family transcriptional regulator [Halopseudomonas xinjiangensis]HEC46352.1 TetR/AcrR family transcriptional regulator [Halopseudomonas xinjiangensis]